MAKSHSSFNEEIFVPCTGSLEHAPVPGKSVSSPSCGSLSQSELVKEAISDPSFLKQVRGLEAMLRVRARAVAPGGAHSDAGVLPVSSGRAACKTDSIDAWFETSALSMMEFFLVLLLVPVLTLWSPARPASARVLRPTSAIFEMVWGLRLILSVSWSRRCTMLSLLRLRSMWSES